MKSLRLSGSALPYTEQFEYMSDMGLISLDPAGILLELNEGERFSVAVKDGTATVIYTCRADIFCGAFIAAMDSTEGERRFENRFELCGAMIDNSRNSVTTVAQMKKYIAYSAAFGLNCVYLYNEDTYEIEGEPYFGYMRDRYTEEDVRELCAFGSSFGVEVIPCMQTLAHLNQALRWYRYGKVLDMGDTLLVDEEQTYELIEKMIAFWRRTCTTEHIHIGMDEAHCLGRGKHLDKHGAEPKFDILCRHLERVAAICRKYGFKPMMWSDMFFRIAFGGYYSDDGIDKALLDKVPKDVTLVYWDYYSTDREKYIAQLKKHALFDNEIGFAGGAWKWSGFTPSINHSWTVSKMALEEVKKSGVKQAMVTCWGDDGAECLSACVLPVLALYGANRLADGEEADTLARELFSAACGYTADEMFTLCRPSVTPAENLTPYANPTKYLFYNDVLKGLFDRHVDDRFSLYYRDCAAELEVLAERESPLNYLFDVQAKLCRVLELKATAGIELKRAYDEGDRITLAYMADSVLPAVRRRTEEFYDAFRAGWMRESRPGGFDTHDLRIGGMLRRVLAAERTVRDYIEGRIDSIPELEAERLYFDCRPDNDGKSLTIGMNHYHFTATSNIL
ncbi:MAG: beta-N-acetylhexosaminidase [Clostridia bacterium]|nr:beta-N-acetylhexosaminidase [Clostridia bacterium]MBR6594949.1 beta-N-acetylhexosaminidase [Clostridia bacterium]